MSSNMSNNLNQSNRAKAKWQACLASAFRTVIACAIVGGITLYSPASVTHQIAFPAFSYVTVILVVTDATLGDTLRGCWLALYATIQTLGPAILSLWLIGPAKLTSYTTSLAVALAAFVVAFPESNHVVSKRIALGQIVITYVLAYINGEKTDPIMHPIQVAASTFLGVFACVLALLLPLPRLACNEVQQNRKLLTEILSGRMKLLVQAYCAEDNSSSSGFLSRAKPLGPQGSRLLQNIKRYLESMQWERVPLKLFKPFYFTNGGRILEEIEIPIGGMEMALSSCSFPVKMMNQQLEESLLEVENLINQSLEKAISIRPRDPPTFPEPDVQELMESIQTLQKVPKCHKDLPSFFFLYCMKLLHRKTQNTPNTCTNPVNRKVKVMDDTSKQNSFFLEGVWKSCTIDISCQGLLPAFKCSLSLGLAILFGSLYSKENGFWAGLPVAVSYAAGREATFNVANVKLQGTVLGTVYGVLGCFLFHKILPVRFFSLLPWLVFTSFLRQSKMYGPAGGISAVIGAVLILGRKKFGTPEEFAIARIVETFVGLGCSIMVELIFQPKRASTLAKFQISKSLSVLHGCIASIRLNPDRADYEESQKKLGTHLKMMRKFIEEAAIEPNFWFMPFPSACYSKLLESLSKIADLLVICDDALRFMEQESHRIEASWKDKLEGDFQQFRTAVGSSMNYLGEVTSLKSIRQLDKELEKKNISYDLEMGNFQKKDFPRACKLDEEEMHTLLSSFLQHSEDILDGVKCEKELIGHIVLSLAALAFCLSTVIRETKSIEEGIKEALQWENPSSNINLPVIYNKINALKN